MASKDRDYSNDQITVHWRPTKCIHCGNCAKELPSVFNPRARPWINMDGATTSKIIEVVNNCPSGALSFSKIESTTREEEVQGTIISIVPDGPILVKGNCVIDNAGEITKGMEKVALCRCGASANKPYCDGAHNKIKFKG